MNRLILAVALSLAVPFSARPVAAQDEAAEDELRRVLADFVRGWREGDAELLSRVLALEEGRIVTTPPELDRRRTAGDGASDNADLHAARLLVPDARLTIPG